MQSQDFIESILRRGAKGIEIKEFTLLTGEDEKMTESLQNLQKMYAYQEVMRKKRGESICHSARLRCEYGSQEYILNLTKAMENTWEKCTD